MRAPPQGEFRFAHARLIEHAEEVALYQGEKVEASVLVRTYGSLVRYVGVGACAGPMRDVPTA